MRTQAPPVNVCVYDSGVLVQAEPGRIRFDVSQLVEAHGGAFLHRLLDLALRLEAIQAVAIDRARSAVTIEYDPLSGDLDETLKNIAAALRGERPSRAPDLDVAVDFSGIAGIVTRVDRIRRLAGEMAAPSDRSTGFSGWLLRLSRNRFRSASSNRDGRTRAVLHGLIVHFSPTPSPDDLPGKSCAAAAAMVKAGASKLGPTDRQKPAPQSSGICKLANLAAAGGCFLLSVFGVVTPGVPTIPFVLATSYFLVRSTPEWNERLRQSRMFGQLVRDWEDSGGLRRGTKVRTIAFMFVLMGVTLRTATSVPILALTGVMATVDLWVVLCLPTIADENEPKGLTWQPA